MRNGLQTRGRTYYFRRSVPKNIRHLFPTDNGKPRTEWVWSLGVKDHEAAKRLVPAMLAKTNEWIDRARQAILVAAAEIPARHTPTVRYPSAVADDLERASLEGAEAQYKIDLEIEWKAETDPDFALSLDLRAAKARELQAITLREQDRELAVELSARNRIGLLELFDRYAAIPGRTAKTMAQWRPYLAKLAAFIGDDDANAVTHAHLQNWRNHLRDHATYRGGCPELVQRSVLVGFDRLARHPLAVAGGALLSHGIYDPTEVPIDDACCSRADNEFGRCPLQSRYRQPARERSNLPYFRHCNREGRDRQSLVP